MPRVPSIETAGPAFSVRMLRFALVGGAVLDLVGAFAFFFFAESAEGQLQLPKQTEFWPGYASVFLVVLAFLYCVSAINPLRSLANVGVAMVGRGLGAAFYGVWCFTTPGLQVQMFLLAVANLVFAFAYYLILGESGRAQLFDSFRPPTNV